MERPAHDGVAMKEIRVFDEKEGWIVKSVPIGDALATNQATVPSAPKEPAIPVTITVADVSLDLARQVVEANGMVVLPPNFLTDEQLAELKADLSNVTKAPVAPQETGKQLSEKETIKLINAAASFDELNALTANESRAKVLAAAESRAADLKEQGAA